jgi:hypothetical protein
MAGIKFILRPSNDYDDKFVPQQKEILNAVSTDIKQKEDY